MQAAFESQSEELAKVVAQKMVQKESLTIKDIYLTAVDVNAVAFVLKHVKSLKVLK